MQQPPPRHQASEHPITRVVDGISDAAFAMDAGALIVQAAEASYDIAKSAIGTVGEHLSSMPDIG